MGYSANILALHGPRTKPRSEQAFVIKRMLDITVATSVLILLSPFLLVVTALIWLDAGGPILYCGTRIGRKGKAFACYKFRTMLPHADRIKDHLRSQNERSGAFFKIANDPRITRVGTILRRYSLDELPQLWNVLLGDMSLVGPRPHPPDDVERYHMRHIQRLSVLPGMTGLWQVTARRDPSFERSVTLDLEYIERWSLWLDVSILCKTVAVVLQGSGV